MNPTMEQLLANLETAQAAREPLSAAFALAKQELTALEEAAAVAQGAGTADEQAEAANAVAAGQTALAEAEAALQAADNAIAVAGKDIEKLEQTMNEDKLRESAREKNDKITANDPEAKETWMLVTTTEFSANHPYDGTVFNVANPKPHLNDKWVRDQVQAGILAIRGTMKA